MKTVAAKWGYLGLGESVEAWGAHHIADTPQDLLQWLAMA
jgi:phosphoglycolate phosphatase